MGGARIDQNQPAGRRPIFCAFVRKRLPASRDEAEHVIIMTVPWISMLHIIRVQQFDIKLWGMYDFRPFLGLHKNSVAVLYHSRSRKVLQDIALFETLPEKQQLP
jgi:hypothetical protein